MVGFILIILVGAEEYSLLARIVVVIVIECVVFNGVDVIATVLLLQSFFPWNQIVENGVQNEHFDEAILNVERTSPLHKIKFHAKSPCSNGYSKKRYYLQHSRWPSNGINGGIECTCTMYVELGCSTNAKFLISRISIWNEHKHRIRYRYPNNVKGASLLIYSEYCGCNACVLTEAKYYPYSYICRSILLLLLLQHFIRVFAGHSLCLFVCFECVAWHTGTVKSCVGAAVLVFDSIYVLCIIIFFVLYLFSIYGCFFCSLYKSSVYCSTVSD